MNLKGSKTEKNLMEAFQGESMKGTSTPITLQRRIVANSRNL